MADWFRSWHGAPTDPKWLAIAARAKVPAGIVSAIAWALLDRASQADDRGSVEGFDIETYAAFSGFRVEKIEAVMSALKEKGVIINGRLAAWDRRQPQREDYSGERVKAFRERRNAVKRDVTQCNAVKREETPEESRGDKIREDTDKIQPSADAQARRAPDPRKTIFDEGVPWLAKAVDRPPSTVRALVAKWCHARGDPAVAGALVAAQQENPVNAISWIEARLKSDGRRKSSDYENRRALAGEFLAEPD